MAAAEPTFVPSIAAVRRAIGALVEARANPVTPGYLCVLEAASNASRTTALRPRFRMFFDRYLYVADAPEKKPYLVPFGRTGTGKALLFNRNVAGSYAPSSMREVNPLYDVLEISAAGNYTLLEGHAEAVRERILPRSLPFCATATFLYRDFGFEMAPGPDDLLNQLNEDFGFALGHDLVGSGIFMDDRADFGRADFEPLIVQ